MLSRWPDLAQPRGGSREASLTLPLRRPVANEDGTGRSCQPARWLARSLIPPRKSVGTCPLEHRHRAAAALFSSIARPEPGQVERSLVEEVSPHGPRTSRGLQPLVRATRCRDASDQARLASPRNSCVPSLASSRELSVTSPSPSFASRTIWSPAPLTCRSVLVRNSCVSPSSGALSVKSPSPSLASPTMWPPAPLTCRSVLARNSCASPSASSRALSV